jgi:hypothetical protein
MIIDLALGQGAKKKKQEIGVSSFFFGPRK